MLKNKLNYLLFLLLFLCPLAGAKAAGTDVSTAITSPDWTEANSPYIVSGTIEVTKGATLKIEAGTEIKFNPGAKIVVNGELDVLGTAENPVVMTASSTSPKAGDWGGIEFTDSSVDATMSDGNYVSGSIIQYAIIKFSDGISCDDASPYIVNNQLSLNTTALAIFGDDYSTGGLVDNASDATQNSSLVTIYVENNNFSDNTLGIYVGRNNGRNYISTPGGYSYIGDKKTTSYISGNTINSNSDGLQILNGDNNYITGNDIKYNFATGLKITDTSRGNTISRNTINNNNIGLDIDSDNSLILQNNIKNNFNTGIKITAKPVILALNNIYNNQTYNIDNRVYNLGALDNYWGTTDTSAINASFQITDSTSTSATSTSATSTATMSYPVKIDPILSAEATVKDLFDPIITSDLSSTSTVFSKLDISGIKPVGTGVYFGDTRVAPFDDNSEWTYSPSLSLGDNTFVITYHDLNGRSSNAVTIGMYRSSILSAPTINSIATSTSLEKITLSGTKSDGSSLWLNGAQITDADSARTWSYTIGLTKGSNKFSFLVKDAYNGISPEAVINITRTAVPVSDITAEEKSLTKNVDAKLAAKLAGKLLLQTERAGLIWYVNPSDNKRYYISQEGALDIFRKLALGISEANLKLIPTKESGAKGNATLRNKLKGKLLIRVEAKGAITYVDNSGYRHDISATNLMASFRTLSLGISNVNLRKITVGELK
jgi:hypothetical protein